MTREQVENLCAELGMQMVGFRNRIIYRNYVVGNYYFDKDFTTYKLDFIGSCIRTNNYETALKEARRKAKEIKEYIARIKLKEINKDFV